MPNNSTTDQLLLATAKCVALLMCATGKAETAPYYAAARDLWAAIAKAEGG